MRKEIVLVLVAAVLLLGGVAAAFENVDVSCWQLPAFDPGGSGGGPPITPCGDPLPPGPPL
jgi:hypothetical protein